MVCILKKATRIVASGFFILSGIISGCATLQTDLVLQNNSGVPEKVELNEVPFFPQKEYQCGPAALATILVNNGLKITPEELTPQVYLPELKGSIQPEILAASRRNHNVPYVIQPSMQKMLTEIASGNPVLIMQNLGLSWIPAWHYAVVVGYDLKNAELILRSGIERRHVVTMRVFERTWARAGYWAIVILPVDQMPVTAEESSYIKAVLAFEKVHGSENSWMAYSNITQKWPQSYTAWVSLGNSQYSQKKWQEAERAYLSALEIKPEAADAWNNLADTQLQMKKYEDALHSIKQALDIGGERKTIYEQTLNQIESKQSLK